jgi:ABC-type nitrate/sulfonate/bicarbonate transport system permease component
MSMATARNGTSLTAGVSPPVPVTRSWRSGRLPWRGTAGVIAALAVWEVLAELHAVSPQYLPTVQATASALIGNAGSLASAAGSTLAAAVTGAVVAGLAGAIAGLLTGYYRVLSDLTEWIVRAFRSIPSLAFIPVAILFFGLTSTMITYLVAIACFWPVLVNARYAAGSLPREYRDTAAALHLSAPRFLVLVMLPACAPSIVSGLKTSLGISLVAAVSAELIVGNGGLGGLATTAQQTGSIGLVYAVIVLGGWLGWAITRLLAAAEARALRWNYRTTGRR